MWGSVAIIGSERFQRESVWLPAPNATRKSKSTKTILLRWKSAIPGIVTRAEAACASLDPLEFDGDDDDDDEDDEDEEDEVEEEADDEDDVDDEDDADKDGDWDE
jgi:hypothetical protein